MNLKRFGGGCIALGILLSLVALAQPATVADTSTTCVDTWAYGQECSTVQYERPNYARSQLFGVGVFSTFLGLFVYGIGATRGGGSASTSTSTSTSTARSGSSRPPGESAGRSAGPERRSGDSERQPDGPGGGTGGTGGDVTTLSEQVAARNEVRNRSRAEPSTGSATPGTDADAGVDGAARGAGDAGAASSAPPRSAPAGSDTGSAAEERAGSSAGEQRLRAVAGVAASGLASAFALSWLVGLVATVESALVRGLVFAAFALPGMGLYGRYRADEPAAGLDEGEAGR